MAPVFLRPAAGQGWRLAASASAAPLRRPLLDSRRIAGRRSFATPQRPPRARQSVREAQVQLNQELQAQTSGASVGRLVEARGGTQNLSLFNLLTALHKVAKTPVGGSQPEAAEAARRLIDALGRRLAGAEPDPEPSGSVRLAWLCRIAWGAAKAAARLPLEGAARPLLAEVSRLAVEGLGRDGALLKPRDASNLLWAYATAHLADAPLVASARGSVLSMGGALKSQDLANIVWALERLDGLDPEVLDRLCGAAAREVRHFQPVGLAAVIGALARTCRDVPAERRSPGVQNFLSVTAANLEAFVAAKTVESPELAQICWSFAALAHTDAATYDLVASRAADIGWEKLQARDLASLAWSFAAADCAREPVMRAIATAAIPAARSFDAQGLVNLCWAFASASAATAPLFAAAGGAAAAEVDQGRYSVRQLSNLSWAFASSAFLDRGLMARIADRVDGRVPEFRAAELGALLWAQAVLDTGAEERRPAAARLAAAAADLLQVAPAGVWGAREVANTLWALAVLGHSSEAAVARGAQLLAEAAERAGAPDAPTDVHLSQWFVAWLACSLEGRAAAAAGRAEGLTFDGIDPAWLAKCRGVARQRATGQQAFSSSNLHSAVSKEVRYVAGPRSAVVDEHVIADCLVVDIALPEEQLAIEVDGPTHFLEPLNSEGPPARDLLTGAARLKRRLLRRLGWEVHSVTQQDWNRLRQEQGGRYRHVAALLKRTRSAGIRGE